MENDPELSDKDIIYCVLPCGIFPAVLITRGMDRKAGEEFGENNHDEDDEPPTPTGGHTAKLSGRVALGHGF